MKASENGDFSVVLNEGDVRGADERLRKFIFQICKKGFILQLVMPCGHMKGNVMGRRRGIQSGSFLASNLAWHLGKDFN